MKQRGLFLRDKNDIIRVLIIFFKQVRYMGYSFPHLHLFDVALEVNTNSIYRIK